MKTAIVIKVKECSVCTVFYRDVLQLGEPESVSSFGCSFRLGPGSLLMLAATSADYMEHASSASCWAFETPDMEALEMRLEQAGFPLDKESFHLGCCEFRRGTDPEGNVFFVRQTTPDVI